MKEAGWLLKDGMTSKEEHYEQLLGLSGAWKVSAVTLDLAAKRVEVEIGYDLSQAMECPECGEECPHYDHREMREWRHLDTMQFETILRCEVPRCNCPEHGVKTLRVPWAGKGSRFTLLFESFAIEVLQACSSVKAAAELMGMNWHQINEIKRRAVARGLERRQAVPVKYMGIDEKSFRKGHNYISILTDLDRSRVLDVAEGRDEAACDRLFEGLAEEQLKEVKADRHGHVARLHQSSRVALARYGHRARPLPYQPAPEPGNRQSPQARAQSPLQSER